jgi:hypothetical protein
VLYNFMTAKYVLGPREVGSPVTKTPLLLRSALYNLLDFSICADPSGLHQRINKMPAGPQTLYDPVTDRPFTYNFIPRECFPAIGDIQAMGYWQAVTEALKKEMPQIHTIAEVLAKQAQQTELMDDPATLAMLPNAMQQQTYWLNYDAKQWADAHRAMMGGWQTDANSNQTCVEGWMQ